MTRVTERVDRTLAEASLVAIFIAIVLVTVVGVGVLMALQVPHAAIAVVVPMVSAGMGRWLRPRLDATPAPKDDQAG